METMMRREGRLVEWHADRGFGFIAPDDGGPNVFLHIRALPKNDKRLEIGQPYAFDAVLSPDGRERADNVVPLDKPVTPQPEPEKPKRSRWRLLEHLPPFLVIVAFAGIFASVSMVTDVSSNWYIIYGEASFACLVGYWIDKNAAIQKNWRVSETILLLIGLVGGWPGAIVAQEVFRHKTRKGTFRYLFWMTVAINMAAFVQINVFTSL
tara:strand:+ start:299608 stop:300234 length:627 start_codon:yes stop_codon:yes gene_type:complete